MTHTAFTPIRTCAFAIAAVFFISSQASAQGGPNVRVPLPVPVTNQSTPVAFTLGLPTGGPLGSNLPNTFSVPTNKRLVIQYVSGVCEQANPNVLPVLGLSAPTGGVSNNHVLGLFGNIARSFAVGQLVKIYADPGTNVVTVGNVVCSMAFSGLLVTP
jgi:hypothetical protein